MSTCGTKSARSISPAIVIVLCCAVATPQVALAGSLAARRAHVERPAPRDPDLLRRFVGELPIGSTVRLRLSSGERVRGTLMAVDADAMIVRPRTRVPEPTRTVLFEQLDFVELDGHHDNRGTAVLIGVGSAVATFVSLWLIALAAFSD